ncbi:MAG: GAF domain-containing protein [Verrucomicrobium sp.]|nr:GAF domain-containing protein [Verrucomicrobium sp.]
MLTLTGPHGGLRALLEPRKAIRHFLKIARKETGADCGSFILLNPNTGFLDIESSFGMNAKMRNIKIPMGKGIIGWVASTGHAVRIADVRKDRKYIAADPTIRSEMAIPVDIHGQILGVINLDSRSLGHFTAEHEHQIVRLAHEAAEWLQHGWEIFNLRIRDEQLNTLVQMGRSIVSQTNLEDAVQRIVRNGARLMKTRVCSLMLLSRDGRDLSLRASVGTGVRYQHRPPVRVDESLVGVVIKRMKAVTISDVQKDPRFQEVGMARREGLVSLLSVPLIFSAKPIGVLNVYTKEPRRFSNQEIKMFQTLADLSAVAVEKTRLLTRVVDTEENLRQSERLSALGLLAAEVAHEIRNPLTVMQMLFHSLVTSTPMDAAAQKDASIIEDKMLHMNRIVDQILSLVRSAEPIKEPLVVGQMIDDITLLIRHKLTRQNIEIRRVLADPLPRVLADRAQLEQALLNLILNASGAMPEGGVLTLGAAVEKYEETTYVAISVRDNGVGMTPAQVDNLFAPFLTTKVQGTGIGLALVKRIMENHHGKITVASRKDKGTKFSLLLPIADSVYAHPQPAARQGLALR